MGRTAMDRSAGPGCFSALPDGSSMKHRDEFGGFVMVDLALVNALSPSYVSASAAASPTCNRRGRPSCGSTFRSRCGNINDTSRQQPF